MAKALINGKMITWGRNRSDVTPDALAKKLDDIPTERLLQWEQGEDKPTLAQAQKIANTLHIPLGYLYLDTPPQELTDTPDLRTVRNESRADYSPAFIETYQSVLLRQQWFREFRLQEGYPELPFVRLFNPQSRVEDVVQSMTTLLEVESLRQQAGSKAKFANLLIEKAESLGILVFRNGLVGRIYDTYAPAIFVNTKVAKSTQVFSILNELAHIWIGNNGNSVAIENLCNRIAGDLLENTHPNPFLLPLYLRERRLGGEGLRENARLYRQNGKLFSHALLSQLYEGKVLFRDAARLLGIKKLDSIDTYYRYLTAPVNQAA